MRRRREVFAGFQVCPAFSTNVIPTFSISFCCAPTVFENAISCLFSVKISQLVIF